METEIYLRTQQLQEANQQLREQNERLRQMSSELAVARQLRQSQEILQAVVDGAAAAIHVKDAQGRFLLVNQRFAALLGKRRHEIVGRSDRDLYAAAIADRIQARDREVLAAGVAVEFEDEVLLGGQRLTLQASEFPLFDLDREPYGVCTIAYDVTSARLLEVQLRQSQKMEAIGRLAGSVAHDFNNLLTAILGYSELLGREVAARPDLRSHVAQLRKAGERGAALTRQLLAISRNQVLQPQEIDLNEVVIDIEAMLQRLIGEDIELVTHLRSPAASVLVDPGQLEQVILNLTVNARDAMPGGGRLIFETADVELDAHYVERHPNARPGLYVVLVVSDTGHGMDAATRAHLFEPFFTTKEKGKGTGLGLSTVYGIVRQSGGHVEVYSEPGVGSTFKIYLPRIAAAARQQGAPAAAEPPPAAAGSATVLVIEDEASIRALAGIILQAGGYTVLSGDTVEEALALAGRHPGPIHLLITDVVMPGMSGPEAAASLAVLHPEARVLFTSGFTGQVLEHKVLPRGSHFLDKPFTAEQLLRTVRELLDRSTSPPPRAGVDRGRAG